MNNNTTFLHSVSYERSRHFLDVHIFPTLLATVFLPFLLTTLAPVQAEPARQVKSW